MPPMRMSLSAEEINAREYGKDIVVGEHATGGVIKYRIDRPATESWSIHGLQTTTNQERAERCAKAIADNQIKADSEGYKKVKGWL